MKLTSAGSDFHLAVLLLAAMAIVGGGTVFAALALGLVFASIASFLLLKVRTPRSVDVISVSGPLRVLKGEQGRITLSSPGLRDSWARVEIESIVVDGPVAATRVGTSEAGVEFLVEPRLAGRFTGVEVTLAVADALGLYHSTRTTRLADVTIDSLPLSLVTPLRRAFIPPLVMGESPAGTAGKGQEFYGIEEYSQHSESKDIMWSRAAKHPEKPLLARVREANSPESVRVDVVRGRIKREEWAELIDLQCEALGALGRALTLAGIRVEMELPDGTALDAQTEEELAEMVMKSSEPGPQPQHPLRADGHSVLVIVGEVTEATVLGTSRRPTVFIGGRWGRYADRYATVFTGSEDLSGMIGLVLSR